MQWLNFCREMMISKKAEIIRATYRQVLGNAYVMDSERDLITESQFKLGELSVRELVRKLAKSDLYRTRFFDSCSRIATLNSPFVIYSDGRQQIMRK